MEENIVYSNILTKSCNPSVAKISSRTVIFPTCVEKYGNDYYVAPSADLLQGIAVGDMPVSLRFDSARAFLYVANSGSSNVSVVDILTKTVVNTISVGTNPVHLQLDSDNNLMYVVSDGGEGGAFGSVSVINTNSQSLIATIYGLIRPRQVAVDNVNKKLYVSSFTSNNITVINNPDNLNYTVDRQINIGDNSFGVTYYNNRLFITSPAFGTYMGDSLYVYDLSTNSIANTIPWGSSPYYITLLRGNKIGISSKQDIRILNADNLSYITIGSYEGIVSQGGSLADIRLDSSPGSQIIYSGGIWTIYVITLCPNTIP